uniref:Uncharacterized protein n=1 Tax=Arundo donax TaxID=35708 RepID=A0A0A8XW46_ARUDO
MYSLIQAIVSSPCHSSRSSKNLWIFFLCAQMLYLSFLCHQLPSIFGLL